MSKYKIYHPQYYKKFQCSGSECKNTCCQSWTILIDKPTYEKYMNLDDKAGNVFSKRIAVTSHDPFNAVMLLLSDNKKCPFLSSRGLCEIQAEHGHEYLCYTCMVYPRKYNIIAGELEVFLELSCEVVAKLVLFEQNIMRFEDSVFEMEREITNYRLLDAAKYTSAKDAENVYWKLRTCSIIITQSRQYRLAHRLLILGTLITQADELISSGNDNDLTALTEMFLERLDNGFYDSLGESAPSAIDLDPGFIIRILDDLEAKNDLLLNKCIKDAKTGLDIKDDDKDFPQSFSENYQRYYELYFADKEFIFENYVVNCILSDGFPFNFKYQDKLVKNYNELLVKYNLVKFLFVGVSRRSMKYDKRRVLECVSSFSRNFDHQIGGALRFK